MSQLFLFSESVNIDNHGICFHTLFLGSNVNTCWEKEQRTQQYNMNKYIQDYINSLCSTRYTGEW